MNISIDSAIAIYDVLWKIDKQNIHGKLAFLCYRNARKLQGIVNDFNKQKDSLIRKYGEENDGNFSLSPNSQNYKSFLEEINPILTQSEDVDLYQISETEFEALSDADLSVRDFAILDKWLVKHDSENPN